jgi:carbonic anhydrase
MRLVVNMIEVNQFMVQKQNFFRFEGSLQPYTCASHTSEPIGNTIYGDHI